MKAEPQITFRNMPPSDAIRAEIADRIEQLAKFHNRITACRVVIDAPHRHSHKGKIYAISVDIAVPGGEIVVNQEPGMNHAHEDIYVAIRDAFNATQRQLEDHVRKHSPHRTKHSGTPEHGTVVRLFSEEGYGFITTGGGHEVYFSRDSVVKARWDRIDIGAEVRFVVVEGDMGPYAQAVNLLESE